MNNLRNKKQLAELKAELDYLSDKYIENKTKKRKRSSKKMISLDPAQAKFKKASHDVRKALSEYLKKVPTNKNKNLASK